MNYIAEIDQFVKNPILLAKVSNRVINSIDSNRETEETRAMEVQLREIAKTIEKLEKIGVAVPDSLRAEKTRLVSVLSRSAETTRTLQLLLDVFEEICKDLRNRLGRLESGSITKKKSRSNAPKTEMQAFRQLIIDALKKFNGKAKVKEVLDEIEQSLSGKFLPGDLETRQDGKTLVWRNNAQWERMNMVRAGILKNDSPNGIWELSEGYR